MAFANGAAWKTVPSNHHNVSATTMTNSPAGEKQCPSESEVEEFITVNHVDERAAEYFRECSNSLQKEVMALGLAGARNPSSALIARVKAAKSGNLSRQFVAPFSANERINMKGGWNGGRMIGWMGNGMSQHAGWCQSAPSMPHFVNWREQPPAQSAGWHYSPVDLQHYARWKRAATQTMWDQGINTTNWTIASGPMPPSGNLAKQDMRGSKDSIRSRSSESVRWVKVTNTSLLAEMGLALDAPVVSFDASQDIFKITDQILQDMVSDATAVTLYPYPGPVVFLEVGEALRGQGDDTDSYCVSTCMAKGTWAVGIGDNLKDQETAAKFAMSLALAQNVQSSDVLQRIDPSFNKFCQAIGIRLVTEMPMPKKRRLEEV